MTELLDIIARDTVFDKRLWVATLGFTYWHNVAALESAHYCTYYIFFAHWFSSMYVSISVSDTAITIHDIYVEPLRSFYHGFY